MWNSWTVTALHLTNTTEKTVTSPDTQTRGCPRLPPSPHCLIEQLLYPGARALRVSQISGKGLAFQVAWCGWESCTRACQTRLESGCMIPGKLLHYWVCFFLCNKMALRIKLDNLCEKTCAGVLNKWTSFFSKQIHCSCWKISNGLLSENRKKPIVHCQPWIFQGLIIWFIDKLGTICSCFPAWWPMLPLVPSSYVTRQRAQMKYSFFFLNF